MICLRAKRACSKSAPPQCCGPSGIGCARKVSDSSMSEPRFNVSPRKTGSSPPEVETELTHLYSLAGGQRHDLFQTSARTGSGRGREALVRLCTRVLAADPEGPVCWCGMQPHPALARALAPHPHGFAPCHPGSCRPQAKTAEERSCRDLLIH